MAIEKMRLVNLMADKEQLDDVLYEFVHLDNFHPQLASTIAQAVPDAVLLNQRNPYAESLAMIREAAALMNYELKEQEMDYHQSSKGVNQQLISLKEEYQKSLKVKETLEQVIAENKDALLQLEHLEGLGFSIDELFMTRYLKVRLGRLPIANVDKLKYYGNHPFLFRSLHTDHVYSWCMYMTTPAYEGEVDNIFSSLYFERIHLPSFVHGEPGKAMENLRREIEDDEKQLEHVNQVLQQRFNESISKLEEAYSLLMMKNRMFHARKYVVCFGSRILLTGFVPKSEIEQVKQRFMKIKNIEIEDRPAHSDKRLQVPTRLKNHWLVAPFSFFVEMYGIPSYEDFDPTTLVAITYLLLFGIMFGDFGQGLLLSLLSALLYRKKGWSLAAIGIRIGLSSAFFGLIYGSVFGNETMLNPFYEMLFRWEGKPIEVLDASFTMTLLLTAVGIGIAIICICMIINIILQLRNKNIAEALFSQNGLAGFVFYFAVIIAIAMTMLGYSIFTPIYIGGLIVLPLGLIFMKEPLERKLQHGRWFPDGFGAFFTESFFELFEVLLTFIANTMSFLRVGGFVLSHAGMMLVVMTLAEMVGVPAAWLVVVLGNLFVMAMEGMIVGIQVLRLEFYEMFSRCFDGKGIEFTSVYDLEMKGME